MIVVVGMVQVSLNIGREELPDGLCSDDAFGMGPKILRTTLPSVAAAVKCWSIRLCSVSDRLSAHE